MITLRLVYIHVVAPNLIHVVKRKREQNLNSFNFGELCQLFSLLIGSLHWSIKCQKIVKKPKVTSSDFLFCPTTNPKPKYIQFTVSQNRETLHSFTFEKLEFLLEKMTYD